jgi:hypothetical protein
VRASSIGSSAYTRQSGQRSVVSAAPSSIMNSDEHFVQVVYSIVIGFYPFVFWGGSSPLWLLSETLSGVLWFVNLVGNIYKKNFLDCNDF